jgi:restriction system protein
MVGRPRLVVAALVVLAAVLLLRARPVLGVLVLGVVVLSGVAVFRLRRRGDRARIAESRRRTAAAILAHETRRSALDGAFPAAATMTGPQFERLVAGLLERDGCEDVRVSGGSGDRGADLTAISPHGDRVVVQCKRYKAGNPVRDPEMQRFLGTARPVHNAAIPLFVTTSRFTGAAVRLAREHGIVLVDGVGLEAWMAGGPSPLPREPTEHVG